LSPLAAIRAVLFDFDGTLADSYTAITASVNHVRSLHGLPPLPLDEVKKYVGRGAETLMERVVPHGDVAADVAAYREHHPSVLRSGTRLFPGVAETLRTLHGRGVRLVVCSNKPVAFTRELLDFLKLAPLIEVALGPEDVARPKPAPDMLLAALERLGISAAEALYVGDMTVDIETARAAGVAVWAVATGSDEEATLRAARPDRLLHSLSELVEAVGAS
jgi:phosphoglycolate phosphatase